METDMRRRKIMQWTAVGVATLAVVLVLGWRLTGCAPSSAAEITFTIALDTRQTTGSAYGVRYLPATVLIDEEGIIREIKVGAFRSKGDVVNWLDDIIARESTPPLDGVRPAVGYAAPDFSLPTLEGGTVELSQLRGKWVLVNFWATWCGYCVAQQPYLQAAFEERGAQIEFIGINVGESEQKVREHIKG
jgi:peroxiredoxin